MVIIMIIAFFFFFFFLEILIIVINNESSCRAYISEDWLTVVPLFYNHVICVFHRLARTARVRRSLCRQSATQRATTSVLTAMLQVSDIEAVLLHVHIWVAYLVSCKPPMCHQSQHFYFICLLRFIHLFIFYIYRVGDVDIWIKQFVHAFLEWLHLSSGQ